MREPFRPNGRRFIVCVLYAVDRVAPTLAALARLHLALGQPSVVFVTNSQGAADALAAARSALLDDGRVVAHDNKGLEFGAYQRGLDAVAGERPDWVVFANDTFSTHHHFSSVYQSALVGHVGRLDGHPIIAGQIESSPRSWTLCGTRMSRWITSNIFALNGHALAALGGEIYRPQLDDLITASSDPDRFFARALDPVLREHLTAWLLSPDGSAYRWYGGGVLSEANAHRLALKARSILQESGLAARLEAVSAEFATIKGTRLPAALKHALLSRLAVVTLGVGRYTRTATAPAPPAPGA